MNYSALFYIIDTFHDWLPLIVVGGGMIGLVIFLIIYNIRCNNKARNITANWANENGLQLLEFKPRLGPGPFGGWVSRGHAYYEFTVCDMQGTTRMGWTRFDITPFSTWEPEIRWPDNLKN